MWALDRKVKMPDEEELSKMSIENTPKDKEEAKNVDKEAAKKMFPFMLRVTYPKMIIIKEKKQ